MKKDIIIVGAGAAGIGVAALLQRMGLDFMILEKDGVGSSFEKWPEEMQMISPSFTGNFFGMPDLNAITPDTSPAYTLLTEHPSGKQYAQYLKEVAGLYELPIEKATVHSIEKKENFVIKTDSGEYEAKYVVWAAGEFQYPNNDSFPGAELCLHTSSVTSWSSLKQDSYFVIGAYESGIDAAYQLAKQGKKVTVLDSGDELENVQSDSSYSLSPFTRDRYESQKENITVISNARVKKITNDDNYIISTEKKEFTSQTKPILATGFKSSLLLVNDFFEHDEGVIQLTEDDESTLAENLFLAGPQVRHKEAIFCFIYKFRQRFAIVAETIATRLGKLDEVKEIIEEYNKENFYMRDLSCCGDECPC